uniref:Uncharacterized protein n=1 Tax=Ditylenchus dipsaci TaxID=166011 RepID=A0A915DMC1_9BILA
MVERARRIDGALLRSKLLLLLILQISVCSAISVFEDYEECRDREKFGLDLSLICDPDHKLQRATLRSLDSLLRDLQNKITCECENQCERGEGLTNKYVGLLLVTTTAKIDAGAESLNQSARKVYEDAKLGDSECSNGLLIIYIKDQQKLATYRGNGRFAQLDEKDMARLHELATKAPSGENTDDSVALQFLLSNHEDEANNQQNVQRAESWAPIIGLTVALVIILIILALLLALLLAKICGCCCGKGSQRKDKYYVNPRVPSYKTIEPIYIVTPSLSEHPGTLPHPMRSHHHQTGLYQSPYGGVVPPPPPPLGSRPIVTHPASTLRSRSVTPTSTHRIRIHPQHSTEFYPQHSTSTHGSVKSPDQTPQANKRDRVARNSTTASKHSNATYYTASNIIANSPDSAENAGIVALHQRSPPDAPPHRSILLPQHRQPLPVVPYDPNNPATGLSFLDPHRRQETQTREEFIS